MNAPAADDRRARVLHALGITPWQLRTEVPAAAQGREQTFNDRLAATPARPPAPVISSIRCVVVLPAECGARELDLLGRALTAYGAVLARAARVMVRADELVGPVPEVPAYLVFGEAQARALGRGLPAAVTRQAHIALADEPARLLTAAAKRRLWSALRQLRRALAAPLDG
jgi:hypothetical protein